MLLIVLVYSLHIYSHGVCPSDMLSWHSNRPGWVIVSHSGIVLRGPCKCLSPLCVASSNHCDFEGSPQAVIFAIDVVMYALKVLTKWINIGELLILPIYRWDPVIAKILYKAININLSD